MTQQERSAKEHVTSYKNSTATGLDDVYGKCSSRKRDAWRYCENLCRNLNGTDLKVVSFNMNVFTAGFQFIDKDTGVVRYMHITPSSDTAVDM